MSFPESDVPRKVEQLGSSPPRVVPHGEELKRPSGPS